MVYQLPVVGKLNDAYVRDISAHRALAQPTRAPVRIALFAPLDY
jgi:hypothetical protein